MMTACPIVPNQRQGDDGTALGIPGPGAALPGGSWKCTTGLNLGPVSEHSGGKVAALVGGLCELLTLSG